MKSQAFNNAVAMLADINEEKYKDAAKAILDYVPNLQKQINVQNNILNQLRLKQQDIENDILVQRQRYRDENPFIKLINENQNYRRKQQNQSQRILESLTDKLDKKIDYNKRIGPLRRLYNDIDTVQPVQQEQKLPQNPKIMAVLGKVYQKDKINQQIGQQSDIQFEGKLLSDTQQDQLKQNAEKYLKQQGGYINKKSQFQQYLIDNMNNDSIKRIAAFQQNPAKQFKFLINVNSIPETIKWQIYKLATGAKGKQAGIKGGVLSTSFAKIIKNGLKSATGIVQKYNRYIQNFSKQPGKKIRKRWLEKLKYIKNFGGMLFDSSQIIKYPAKNIGGIQYLQSPTDNQFLFRINNGDLTVFQKGNLRKINPAQFGKNYLKRVLEKRISKVDVGVIKKFNQAMTNSEQKKYLIQNYIG